MDVNNVILYRTLQNIQYETFNNEQCWDNIIFSADFDWGFNISVTPNNCKIETDVNVYLEYYNQTWYQIPIIPTEVIPNQVYNGYQSGLFNHKSVLFFNTSFESDIQNAVLIQQFVEFFKTHLNVSLRLKVVESPIFSMNYRMQQQFISNITKYGNKVTECYNLSTTALLQTFQVGSPINMTIVYNCFKQFKEADNLNIKQFTYTQDLSFADCGHASIPFSKIKSKVGTAVNLTNNITINYDKQYFYLLMLYITDSQGRMLAAMYFQGVAVKTCYQELITEIYNTKVCLKMLVKDTVECRQYLQTTGIVGWWNGKVDMDPSDPYKRQTYFWFNVNFTLPNNWFGQQQRLCFHDDDDTGEYQGIRMYGSFYNRLKELFDLVIKHNITPLISLKTAQGSTFSQTIINYQTKALYTTAIVFTGIMLISVILLFFSIKKLTKVSFQDQKLIQN
ncbi:Conserved_hypothetical protein [Hexamita inflata]|uniref:Transmembrane protein n=1 Tax=Hexamita inflata TaxID=28002 RepID=A0AA86UPV6_9EUKA|nr:Conserved hypothetical protein [Hexamita inflata]